MYAGDNGERLDEPLDYRQIDHTKWEKSIGGIDEAGRIEEKSSKQSEKETVDSRKRASSSEWLR